MKYIFISLFLCSSLLVFSSLKPKHELVNPFIGTGGHGHTYPGAAFPFGMVQLSPDTRLEGWDGCGGYHYSDNVIYGFSHTHLSGTGVSDYGDLLIMPFTGKNTWENGSKNDNANGYGSRFSHSREKAKAGYYSVFLDDDKIDVELTTTARCGIHRYRFLEGVQKKIIIDLEHRDKLIDSDLIFLNDSTLLGKRISTAWAREQHFYFCILLSEIPGDRTFRKDDKGKPTKLILEFGSEINELILKVGVSAVDMPGAKRNLKTEMPHWDFDTYLFENQANWDVELGGIDISTNYPDRKRIFYTALYHSYLNPNLFSDVDGRYRGMDMKIHNDSRYKQYTVFSLWDTFRATHPLFTITQRSRTVEFIWTFMNQYRQGGALPIWELSANYTGCMIGYHAIPVIVDAFVKGIQGFDKKLALAAMMKSSEDNKLGLEAYKKRGYISSEDESESVSKTLEYAYDDWCIAVFADSIGQKKIASDYYKRAQFYKNIFNPDSKFMQPRYNGGWKSNFKPDEVTFDYTEANSWQYSMFVPQDVHGLTELLGGRDELESWLDRLFTASSKTSGRNQADITGLIGQYAHGNEPSHHMAYLYNFTSNPHKTQKYVYKILTQLYSNKPDGLSGNEDCGQMSSWYVMSSLGFYSFCPGSDRYLLGTPLFDTATIHLDNGKDFQIIARNTAPQNYYVKRVHLNGKILTRNYILHSEIMRGGTMIFEMSSTPGSYLGSAPPSKIRNNDLVASPFVTDSDQTFTKKRKIVLKTNSKAPIYYTTDNSLPTRNSTLYTKPIKIKKSTNFKAVSVRGDERSYLMESTFKRSNHKWQIRLNTQFQNQYAGGGKNALIDQVYGSKDFQTGSWQGFLGKNLDVQIDFKKKLEIQSIELSLLQDAKSWIWFPSEVQFMISRNGKDWFTMEVVKNKIGRDEYGSLTQSIGISKELKTRYIRIIAVYPGACPKWHPGSGNKSWIFADEIIVKH